MIAIDARVATCVAGHSWLHMAVTRPWSLDIMGASVDARLGWREAYEVLLRPALRAVDAQQRRRGAALSAQGVGGALLWRGPSGGTGAGGVGWSAGVEFESGG